MEVAAKVVREKNRRWCKSIQAFKNLKQKDSSVKDVAVEGWWATSLMRKCQAQLFLRVVFATRLKRHTRAQWAHSRTQKEIFWQNRVSKGSAAMIKAGQTGRIKKAHFVSERGERETDVDRKQRRRGPDTQFYTNCMWGLHGIIQLLHLASSKGDRASALGVAFILSSARRARFICCLHPARNAGRKGFRFLSISCRCWAAISLIF